jgi:hypothetical protein
MKRDGLVGREGIGKYDLFGGEAGIWNSVLDWVLKGLLRRF